MNIKQCPCCNTPKATFGFRTNIVRAGRYYRKSDRKFIPKFKCLLCGKYFSTSTNHPCRNQNKRQLNESLRRLLCSGVSQRRAARILRISRTTVSRKLCFLGSQAEERLRRLNLTHPPASILEFDDLETFEHSKCKPLSVTLAVEHKTRRILGFEVSQMPAKGKLAYTALKRYGFRKDMRAVGRERLFKSLKGLITESALIKSDENPHYPQAVRRHFPESIHQTFKGQRGSIVGQGELKKIRFDPLFSLNHTCAMFRANVNRLFRKTWCTTKKPERLRAHLSMYALYHNSFLI